MRIYNDITKVEIPALEDGQLYIYVLENYPQGNIKIGKSTNIKQRLQSLSGSNSGGNKITRIAVSDSTYLYTLERLAHNHFAKARIEGTEWFRGEEISFEEAVTYIDDLFMDKSYQLCNDTRKNFYSQKNASDNYNQEEYDYAYV